MQKKSISPRSHSL